MTQREESQDDSAWEVDVSLSPREEIQVCTISSSPEITLEMIQAEQLADETMAYVLEKK